MPPLPVFIVIVIRTNARRFCALGKQSAPWPDVRWARLNMPGEFDALRDDELKRVLVERFLALGVRF
jgi:hypothetical protein